jgi:8-oxo-dGTP pyrophosphatase MutT (NUDIX family)
MADAAEPAPQAVAIRDEAGGIVFRAAHGRVHVLLVSAKKDPGKWIFSKGHVESGESAADTALREVREEAGVEGAMVGPIGRPIEFRSGAEHVRVQYFLIRRISERDSPEGRKKRWLPVGEALEQLSYADARELLKLAAPELEKSSWTAHETADLKELLVVEHQHIAEALLLSEQDGEKRVTSFITTAGLVGAGVGFVVDRAGLMPNGRHPLVVFALLVLLGLGYLTLARVVSRNAASDRFKEGLNRLRRYYFTGPDDERIRRSMPFDPYDEKPRKPVSWRSIKKGGWLETICFANAVIVGTLAAVLAGRSSWWVNGAVGTPFAVLAWIGFIQHGNARYQKEWADLRTPVKPVMKDQR